jgi:replicative DNA helicase
MTEIATLRQIVPVGTGTEPEALPHNIEAEQQLLGAILTNNDVYDRIASLVKADHFFDPVHARIFEIAAARIQKNALASPSRSRPFWRMTTGPARTRRPGLSCPPRRRRDLGLCGARLCADDL